MSYVRDLRVAPRRIARSCFFERIPFRCLSITITSIQRSRERCQLQNRRISLFQKTSMNPSPMNSGKLDRTADLAEPGVARGETIMANHETKTPRVMAVGHVALNARDPA